MAEGAAINQMAADQHALAAAAGQHAAAMARAAKLQRELLQVAAPCPAGMLLALCSSVPALHSDTVSLCLCPPRTYLMVCYALSPCHPVTCLSLTLCGATFGFGHLPFNLTLRLSLTHYHLYLLL